MSDEPTYSELYSELETTEAAHQLALTTIGALAAQSTEQASTIAELETTIDGLADLSRDLESEANELKTEINAAIIFLQGMFGTPPERLAHSLKILIRDLKGAIE
jgi:hypothetical protein